MISLKNKRKNSPEQRRQNRTNEPSSGPVVRYYQPVRNSGQSLRKPTSDKSRFWAREDVQASKSFMRRVRLFFRRLAQWALFVAIAGIIIANGTLSGVSVSTKGTEQPYRSQAEYVSGSTELLNTSLTNRTKLTLQSKNLEKQLIARFPEVSKANVITPLAGRRLNVSLQISPPLLRLLVSANKMAVVTSNGVIAKTDSVSSVESTFAKLPVLSVSGVEIKEGMQLLTSSELELISLVMKEFDGTEKNRPRLQSLEFAIATREIRVHFAGNSFYAKLTPERESRPQVGALVRTIKYLSENQGGGVASEYIDVRVEDRVFVR